MASRFLRLPVLAISCCLFCSAALAEVHKGTASGRVAIIDGPTIVYGFSGTTGTWSSIDLDSQLKARIAGTYIGYARTQDRIYAFNSTTCSWYTSAYSGTPRGEDAKGTTAVAWTNTTAYGISTLWGTWRSQEVANPLGGGSGGNYALIWSGQAGYAFGASSGQWTSQALGRVPVGGYASPGLGLIWTMDAAYLYDPVPGSWAAYTIASPSGVSVDGTGQVGIVWNENAANAYSAILGTWSVLDETYEIAGGVAGEEVAILWTEDRAFAFDARRGGWSDISVASPPAAAPVPMGRGSAFSVGPNPATDKLLIQLPPSESRWKVEIIGLDGACVRTLESPASSMGAELVWDRQTDQNQTLPSGTYWVRAECSERMEARRFVLLR